LKEEISNFRKCFDEKNKLENILINFSKGYLFFFFDFNCLCVLWLGRFINVKDVDEKEVILRSLKNIIIFLPADDNSDMNIEVGNEILNLLTNFAEKLFNNSSEEESFQSPSNPQKKQRKINKNNNSPL
jgi:hypothetical protein